MDGAETELAWGENPYRLAMHEGNLSVNGVSIEVTWTDGKLAWPVVPQVLAAVQIFVPGRARVPEVPAPRLELEARGPIGA